MQLWMEGPTWESVDLYIIYNLETDHGHMSSSKLYFSIATTCIGVPADINTGATIIQTA